MSVARRRRFPALAARRIRAHLASLDGTLPPPHRARDMAGFWRRFGAVVIDAILLAMVQAPLGGSQRAAFGVSVLTVAYYAIGEGAFGATVGKRALGIRVVDADGQFIGPWRGFLRYLGRIASTVVLLLGYFWMLWDRDRQTWHDKLARCYVEKT